MDFEGWLKARAINGAALKVSERRRHAAQWRKERRAESLALRKTGASFADRMLAAGKILVSKLRGQPPTAPAAASAKNEFTKSIAGILPKSDAREVADGVQELLAGLDDIQRLATAGDEAAAEQVADTLLETLRTQNTTLKTQLTNSAAVPTGSLPTGPARAVTRGTAALSLAAFNAMTPKDRMAFAKAGGTLKDDPKPAAQPGNMSRIHAEQRARRALLSVGIGCSDPAKLVFTDAGIAAVNGSAPVWRAKLSRAKSVTEKLAAESEVFAVLAGKSGDATAILKAHNLIK